MKKIRILSILIIISMVFVCACQKKNEKNEETESTSEIAGGFDSFTDGSFILTNGSLNGGASITITDGDGSFSGSCFEVNKDASGVDYDGVFSSNSFTGRFSEPASIDEFTYECTVDEYSIEKNVGDEEIKDGKKQINMLPYGISKGAKVTVFYPGAKTSGMPDDFIEWTKNSYYFEGETLPVTGLMINDGGINYGWILQEN